MLFTDELNEMIGVLGNISVLKRYSGLVMSCGMNHASDAGSIAGPVDLQSYHCATPANFTAEDN